MIKPIPQPKHAKPDQKPVYHDLINFNAYFLKLSIILCFNNFFYEYWILTFIRQTNYFNWFIIIFIFIILNNLNLH